MEKEVSYNELLHAYDVLQELNKFRESKEQCDFLIKIGLKEIHVHRNVLCVNSDYFKAMLAHDTRENQTGCVELKDMDEECVLKCADFMYGKKMLLSNDKWQQMVDSANRLQMQRLIEHLVKFFQSHLEVQNLYTLRNLALTNHFSELEEKCEEFASINFHSVSQFDEFSQLPLEYLEILIRSPMNKVSVTCKLMAFLKWIQHDSSSRGEFLPQMLRRLDLTQIPMQYRRHLLEKETFIAQSLDCVKLLSISVLEGLNVQSMAPDDHLETYCLAVFDDTSRQLQCFDHEKNTFLQMHKLLDSMTKGSFSTVVLLDYVYVFFKNKKVSRLRISHESASWEQVAETIDHHGRIPPAVVDEKHIYVAGSWKGGMSCSIEKYEPLLNKWSKLSEKEIKKNATCVYMQTSIYCIGGIKTNGNSSSGVKAFDLDTKKWRYCAPLLRPRCYAAVATHFGKIYVVGGDRENCALSEVECYDCENNTWISLCPMVHVRKVFKVLLIKDDFYAVGGCGLYPGTMEKYSISDDVWTEVDISDGMNLKILSSVGLTR